MIELGNKKVDFIAASGALGLDGSGWWWEKPLRWAGLLRPEEFTIITKTLTYRPCRGHLDMWKPWQCVRFIPGGTVNSVGLTNPGIFHWIEFCYPEMMKQGLQFIPSIWPNSPKEAENMAKTLDKLPGLTAIEINVSCPNTEDGSNYDRILQKIRDNTSHPLIVKIGWHSPIEGVCKKWSKEIQAFDVINAVPWNTVFPDKETPLAKYNLIGGVSGSPIKAYGRTALKRAREVTDTPIISGGGIDGYEEACYRFDMGANAVAIGVLFLRSPWLPNMIVSKYRKNQLAEGK
jgi:dihydroorotate dehydrogenase (NAD+) catalytic subunit